MNPPYAKGDIEPFVAKLVAEYVAGMSRPHHAYEQQRGYRVVPQGCIGCDGHLPHARADKIRGSEQRPECTATGSGVLLLRLECEEVRIHVRDGWRRRGAVPGVMVMAVALKASNAYRMEWNC